ncbi:MAG: N-acetylglucosaminyltransferase, partial [Kiritimatiellae bacterium]|nr:N-acetylglucosaminyltransferase [Kiritimatiellia bacterium]
MVYDCFTFFNELDLLEIRLNTLKGVVDRFVIAEATRTHTGKPKELIFERNRGRYAEFGDKIVYVVVDNLLPEEEVAKDSYNLPWVNENRQRNALIKGLMNLDDGDVFIVSDVDEIPRPECVRDAVALAKEGECVRFEMETFVYYINFKDYRNPCWYLGS